MYEKCVCIDVATYIVTVKKKNKCFPHNMHFPNALVVCMIMDLLLPLIRGLSLMKC